MSKDIQAARVLVRSLKTGSEHQSVLSDEDDIWQSGYKKALDEVSALLIDLEEALYE